MAPVETQKTPAVGMSDADDAEEDGEEIGRAHV